MIGVAAALYDRLSGVIDRSLYRVFGRRETDHDDLVQSVFEQVVLTLARGSYAGNCSLKTWAARISSNVGLNALRARRRERKVVDHSADLPGEPPNRPTLPPTPPQAPHRSIWNASRALVQPCSWSWASSQK